MGTNDKLEERYEILRDLGGGPFGTTFEARDRLIDRRVALKITTADVTQVAALEREIQVAQRVSDPHLVQVYGLEHLDDGRSCLVRQWIEGASLQDLLSDGPLILDDALDVIEAVSRGLDAMHRQNLIHRDLKPSNVLIPLDGGFKAAVLADFGLAGFLDRRRMDGQQQTRAGEFFGTPAFMTPEQATGEPQTTATDVYGVGALLFNALYGRPPFDASSPLVAIRRIISEPVVLPSHPRIPPPVRSLLERALAKKPSDRFSSAGVFLEALREVRELIAESTGEVLRPPTAPGYPAARALPQTWGEAATDFDDTQRSRGLPPAQAAGAGNRLLRIVLLIALALLTITVAIVLDPETRRGFLGIVMGLVLAGAGIAIGVAVRKWLQSRKTNADQVSAVLFGASGRDGLTNSLALEVDELLRRCREIDERVLGTSVAIFIQEYRDAKDFKDRQIALMNAMQLMEKLMVRLSPWYVRYERVLAILVSLLGVIPGLVKIFQGASALAK